MRKFLVFSFLLIIGFAQSQELNCTVTVNSDKISNSSSQVFKTLQKSLTDFINKTTWTEKAYKPNERINCSMFITVNSFDGTTFDASIQVQSSRPIYNSTYSSPLLNINDKDFVFNYQEFENLTFNPTSFDSNLISVVAFYTYMIIGMDAETYSPQGGDIYFQKAQEIVGLASTAGGNGWAQSEKKQNRYYLVNDLLSNAYQPYRDAIYTYHFNGLDLMEKDLKGAKESLKNTIIGFSELNFSKPNSYLSRVFFDAKADEIVAVFSGGPSVDITDLVDKLNKMSTTNSSKWAQIKY